MAFLEDYTLLEELGQGAFATVYKVRHNKLGYIRAVRVLNKVISQGESDPSYQKFLEECILLLRLGNGNHPNIVHIYQPLLKDQHAVVEMDYVDGQNLYSYMDSHGSFVEIDEVMHLLKDIGGALAYCHEDIYEYCMDRGVDHLQTDPNDGSKVLIDEATRRRLIEKYQVVHNDLHPGNIMRKRNGGYILLDFGLAIEGNTVVRSSRKKNGVPEYKSPEKWRNESHISTQSDIYSFGVILYTMLAGRPPFLLDTDQYGSFGAEQQLYHAHLNETPPSVFNCRKATFEAAHPGQTYIKDYPDWLEALILKCLEKNTADRFQSGKDLMKFVEENEVQSPSPLPEDKESHEKETGNGVQDGNSVGENENGGQSDSSSVSSSSNDILVFWVLLLIPIVVLISLSQCDSCTTDRGESRDSVDTTAVYTDSVAWDSPADYNTVAKENGHEYVDLGLSVKWATCNVGAASPEDYGDYFAWGETSPKSIYNWSTYKWCADDENNMTKYCTDSKYGKVDNKTQLDLSDDAARVNWGGSWRMPTHDEITELIYSCKWTWTTQNGVKGYEVISKINDNSIFLPTAGYRYVGNLDCEGTYGYYWSSSINMVTPNRVRCLDFKSGSAEWNSSIRNVGRTIRPVCP